jgi:hypothetical protein
MNIIQTAVSQPDEIKPDRQREFEIMLSDRSREIIRLFEELERKRHQQAEMNETKSRFVRSKRPFWTRFFRTQRRNATSAIPPRSDIACKISHVQKVPKVEVTNSIQLSHLQPPTNSVESGGSANRYVLAGNLYPA